MKHAFVLFLSLITLAISAPLPRSEKGFDDAHRFIFYAVLEGCFEDGLSTEDVSQILLRPEKETYSHFIYSCPICTPAVHAFEVYRSRPPHFYALKSGASTFGLGLKPVLEKQLYSENPEVRLGTINALMQSWVARRMSLLRLSEDERTQLKKKLEEMRKKGMESLEQLETGDPAKFKMSAFATIRQCAVCNGACEMGLKPDAGK